MINLNENNDNSFKLEKRKSYINFKINKNLCSINKQEKTIIIDESTLELNAAYYEEEIKKSRDI